MANETKFTPGPWFATPAATRDGLSRVDDGRTSLEALHPFYLEHWDACLCAAAPDLYAALEALLGEIVAESGDGDSEYLDAARHALAKARGEA